jgi:hypothetical protein
MPQFLEGTSLNLAVENIFIDAQTELIIISPFIKLHHRLRDHLKDKLNEHKLKITLLVGKNEKDLTKSLPKEEIEFFKEFPNIEIRYEERLHAKYYSNDNRAILTSLNLLDYSVDHNIEAGIEMHTRWRDLLNKNETIDQASYAYFDGVIEKSELLFKKEPQYGRTKIGIGKKYEGSIITENKIESLIQGKKAVKPKVELSSGYCISCGKEIKLDPKRPYCYDHYKEWAIDKNPNHKEKYCHTCGEDNKSSIKYPSCRTCYREHKNELEYPKI